MKDVRILLLQARQPRDRAREEERHSFAQAAAVELDQIIPFDLLTQIPTLDQIRSYDALMVGGSGEYYVSKGNLPGLAAILELLRQTVAAGQPTFASCFGYQLLVQALGGQIIYNPPNMEVGTFELRPTTEAASDELFAAMPARFNAQLGHKDRASQLPPGVINLASSPRSPYQALRVPGKPIWATQFHPELTMEANLLRFRQYKVGYAGIMNPEELQETLDKFATSRETDALIRRFLQVVFD